MFGTDDTDAEGTDPRGSSRGRGWGMARRTFITGVGAAAGLGALAGRGGADESGIPRSSDATYYVYRTDGEYLVANSPTGGVEFDVRADRNAERAFQYAFDTVPDRGGTVVASADTFRFGGPATLGDGTALVGLQGTRFVGSEVGARDDPLPTDDQENPLPRGHDLLRIRGDDVAVTGIEFDGAGTQLDNNAI